ncbi:MAG: tRNA pseudouridine(38-40) synthase TruA [Ilumatobacteraceae bacterium]
MNVNEPAHRRARLTVAYDGAHFHGFAINVGVRTVAGVLTDALSLIARTPIEITGAGRTDAGVHAWDQVVSCDLPIDVDIDGLARRLTKMCAPGVVVRDARWATDPGFDARFSALWRRYRYTVLNDPTSDPFLAPTSWHVASPLNLALMHLACDPLVGEHDFSAFCRKPKLSREQIERGDPGPSLVRRVTVAQWSEHRSDHGARILRFEVQANAFCHQMVRSIVGCLVDVGLGRLSPGDISGILRSRDRTAAGTVAPPQGLTLWQVGYPEAPAGKAPGFTNGS